MKLLMTLIMLLAASSAFAQSWENWRHYETLVSKNGTSIQIDYVIRESHNNKWAAPVYINIRHPEFRYSTNVQVVFINKWCYAGVGEPCPTYLQDVWQLYPRYVDGKFTVSLNDPLYLEKSNWHGEPRKYSTQEVAVQVNGTWLKDSMSGANNFSVDL